MTWQSLGPSTSYCDAVFPGQYEWRAPKVSQEKLFEYFYKYKTDASFDTCGSNAVNNWNCNTQKGDEAVASLYAVADYQFGDVEVSPGLRYEHTKIDNLYWAIPDDQRGRADGQLGHQPHGVQRSSAQRVRDLAPATRPSIAARSGRPTPARPSSSWPAAERRSISDDASVSISRGNPDLKPIKAVNLDLSGEWSNSKGGYAMFGASTSACRTTCTITARTR
ncbi:TonB-dependent receptor domain-containing protein [Caulobacter segnis]